MQTTDPTNLWQSESALATAEARKAKAAKNKDIGSPIQLSGKPLAIIVKGNELWEADSTSVIKKIDLLVNMGYFNRYLVCIHISICSLEMFYKNIKVILDQ